ncbi:MAG: glycosyltransferase [Gammaproteobacteria bacterium]
MIASTFDHQERRHLLECDVVIAISGRGLETGQAVQHCGGYYVCDRGSSHIRLQDQNPAARTCPLGARFPGIDPWVMDRESHEYEIVDAITVPSESAQRSFIEHGIPEGKVHEVPNGVRLDRFFKTGERTRHGLTFFLSVMFLASFIPWNKKRHPGCLLGLHSLGVAVLCGS